MSKLFDQIRFTDGPCDAEEPECLQKLRRRSSLMARKRSADLNLDHVRTMMFIELSRAIGGEEKEWTADEDDALLAAIEEHVLDLCTGGLFRPPARRRRSSNRLPRLAN